MPEPPRISVVVPVYNMAALLPRLLDSVAAQSYPRERWEAVLVDNRSTDRLDEVVEPYPWVRRVAETERQSPHAARMRGISVASGELIACTDADCVTSPDWLQALSQAFQDAPQVGAVAGTIATYPPTTALEHLADRWQLLDQSRFLAARPYPLAATANLTVRRHVLDQLGGFNVELTTGADFELCWRMQAELGLSLGYAPEALVWHRHRMSWRGLARQSWRNGRAAAYLRARLPGYRLPPPRRTARSDQPVEPLLEAGFLLCRGLAWLAGLVQGGWFFSICQPVRVLPVGLTASVRKAAVGDGEGDSKK